MRRCRPMRVLYGPGGQDFSEDTAEEITQEIRNIIKERKQIQDRNVDESLSLHSSGVSNNY